MYKDDGLWHLCEQEFLKSIDAAKEAWRLTGIHEKCYEVIKVG